MPCLILSQRCQLLSMPKDGLFTAILQTPSWLGAGNPPSCFLLALANLPTGELERMTCGDMNLCFSLHSNYLSLWKLCSSLVGPSECCHLSLPCSPPAFVETQRESEFAVQVLAHPAGLKSGLKCQLQGLESGNRTQIFHISLVYLDR